MQISVIYSAILLGRTDSNILQKEAELYIGNGKVASWGAVVGFVVMMSLDVGLG